MRDYETNRYKLTDPYATSRLAEAYGRWIQKTRGAVDDAYEQFKWAERRGLLDETRVNEYLQELEDSNEQSDTDGTADERSRRRK